MIFIYFGGGLIKPTIFFHRSSYLHWDEMGPSCVLDPWVRCSRANGEKVINLSTKGNRELRPRSQLSRTITATPALDSIPGLVPL